jgi:hypothetical protein
MGGRNACTTGALAMGGRVAGMVSESGHFRLAASQTES